MRTKTAKPVAKLWPVRMEIPAPRKGRPGYAWIDGYQIESPGGGLLYPYMRPRNATAFCRANGWTAEIQAAARPSQYSKATEGN